MKPNPYQSPAMNEDVPSTSSAALREARSLLTIVSSQQILMWLLPVKAGVEFTMGIFTDTWQGPMLWGYLLIAIAIQAVTSYFVFRIMQELYGIGPAIVCAVLAAAPCSGTLAVLILNGNVTDYARKRGVKLGFMGATRSQLDELRLRIAELSE